MIHNTVTGENGEIFPLTLEILPSRYAICHLTAGEIGIPDWVKGGALLALVATSDEMSIICDETFVPGRIQVEKGWMAMKVMGPLDFSLVGILYEILKPLAESGISILALSSYETDYVLVKEAKMDEAIKCLERTGKFKLIGKRSND
jgi:hypothetical protein